MSEETEYTHTVDDEKFESYDEAVEYCYQSEIIYINHNINIFLLILNPVFILMSCVHHIY